MARKRHNRGPRRHRVESAPRKGGGRALEVDGVVQSVRVELGPSPSPTGSGERGDTVGADGASVGYWELMLPRSRPRRALIVGLGAGTVAALLTRDYPGTVIVGIERDERVLALARLEFGLDALPGLEVIVADAFAEIPARAEREPSSYDYICLDLYEAGRLAPGTLATGFLRQLATLLTPNGTLAVNLFITDRLGEQLHRIQRVFAIAEQRRTKDPGGNLVIHARQQSADERESVA